MKENIDATVASYDRKVTDQEFQTQADEAIDDLYQRLVKAVETHDFEVDFNSGALAVEFDTSMAIAAATLTVLWADACAPPLR